MLYGLYSSRGFLGEQVVEAAVAVLHAVGHAGGDGAVARFLRRERQIANQRRDTILLAELERDDAGIADWHGAADIARIEVLFVRDLRRRIDLGERAEEAELLPLFAAPPL